MTTPDAGSAENDALDAKARRLCEAHQAGSPTRIPCAACVQDATAENDRPEWVAWECPRCGKTATARARALIRCTCGATSYARDFPPVVHGPVAAGTVIAHVNPPGEGNDGNQG